MESTRPIRALTRGLDALTVLNSRDGATVSEVAQEIRLPRTTVYRILETLCNSGFVFRDAADDRYRLTVEVRRLRHGVDDDAWVSQIAKPHIDELCRDIVWPVSIATLSGSAMMVRESTDHETPLAIERYSAGFRSPLLSSAAGLVFLAYSPEDERNALIDILARSNKEDDKPARAPRAELQRMLAEIKREGYATSTKPRRLVDEVSLGVPVNSHERVFASLTVRFITSAVPLKTALERFLPKLRQCSAVINTLYSEQQSAAHATGAPETAA
jgi:IclR family mhp operon transcriptional activator